MNDKLIQILDKLTAAAQAYQDDNAQIYADEILRLQDEKEELEKSIRETESEIISSNDRLNASQDNLENRFSTIFDIFQQDAIKKEQEAKRKLDERKETSQEETKTAEEKLEKVGQVIKAYKDEIKKIKSTIARASAKENPDQQEIAAMQQHLSSVKEELKITRKEERGYKKDLSNIEKDLTNLTTSYEEARKDRYDLAAQYEAYKRGYAFQYGEKKDGSGEIELQVYPRKKQIERKNAIQQTRINQARERIAELDEREAFLSVTANQRKEKIIELLQSGADYEEIRTSLEELASFISEEEVRETEQQLTASIEEYQERIKNNDYINHQEKQKDEELRKAYQNRLAELTKEIAKANAIFKAPTEVTEKDLESYTESITVSEAKRQELILKSVLMTTDSKLSTKEIRERKIISTGIKELNEKIDRLYNEKDERREELHQEKIARREKAIKDRRQMQLEYARLETKMQHLTSKLLNPTNYIDVVAKVGDQLKLNELQGKLEELHASAKYLKESKSEILKQFEQEYQNIKQSAARTKVEPEITPTQNTPTQPKQNNTEISEDLFNRIIAANGNDDGYIMGKTEVGLSNGINRSPKETQSIPVGINMPSRETQGISSEIDNQSKETIGLPGETIDGKKVGDIKEDVYAKIKVGDTTGEGVRNQQLDSRITESLLGINNRTNAPANYTPTTLLELPGETLDGTKIGDIEQDVYDKIKRGDTSGEDELLEEEEIEEVSSIKDIPRKLLNKIKQFIKNHPILTAAASAIVLGVGALGFGHDKELVASGNVTTETTIAGKDDETTKIGDTYIGTEDQKAYESSDYDYGGKNSSTSAAGENLVNAFSFIDKTTGEIIEVEREAGKSIEDVIKENNINLDNSKVRILLGEKGWTDISIDEIKDQMSRESQTVKSEYDFNMTNAQISDGKVVLTDENGQKIEINTQKLAQGSNQINQTGSDGRLYQGTVEVTEQNRLNDQGDPIKSWSLANVKENAHDILDGLNMSSTDDYTIKLADTSSLDEQAKIDLADSIVEDMASQDYIVDTSAFDNANYSRGR